MMKTWLYILYLIMMAELGFATAASNDDIPVVMTEANGGYGLVGGFSISASTDAVWAVLTDYDGMESFVSSVKMSRTVRDEDVFRGVEQVMSGKVGFFRKRIHLFLKIVESPPRTISFQD